MCKFSAKMGNFDFLSQICPKVNLGLKNEKTNVGIQITFLEILCVTVLSQNGKLLLFWPEIAQKRI